MKIYLLAYRKILLCLLLCIIQSAVYSQVCTSGCTYTISGDNAGNYTVNTGEILCVASSGILRGSLIINGGTVCNNGIIKTAFITMTSGVIKNYGSIYKYGDLVLEDNFPDVSVLENYQNGLIRVAGQFIVHPFSRYLGMDSTAGLIVYPFPLVAVNPSAATICSGSSVTLTASGASTYTWSPATGLNTTAGPIVVASPTSTTTYTVTGTDANGSSAMEFVKVEIINSYPVISITPEVACILPGDSITLTANGAETYTWSPATGLNSSTGSTVIASPATTTTYSVTGNNAGCTGQTTITVTINQLLVAINPSATSVCNGGAIQLTGSGGDMYYWEPSDAVHVPNSSSPFVSPAVTTTYTLTAVSSSGCFGTATAMVSVVDFPVLTAGTNKTICSGGTVALDASGTGSFSWSPPDGLSSTAVANPTASPTASTTYEVTLNNNGCSAKGNITVTIEDLNFSIHGDTVICREQKANLILRGNGVSYQWNPAVTSFVSSNGSQVLAQPSASTTYTVTASKGTCTLTKSVIVTVNPLPDALFTYSFPGLQVQFTPVNTSGTVYSWTFGDGTASTSQSPAHIYPLAGNYNVCLTMTNPCGTVKHCETIKVRSPDDCCNE